MFDPAQLERHAAKLRIAAVLLQQTDDPDFCLCKSVLEAYVKKIVGVAYKICIFPTEVGSLPDGVRWTSSEPRNLVSSFKNLTRAYHLSIIQYNSF